MIVFSEMDPEIIASAKEIVIKRERAADEDKKQDKLDRIELQMAEILKRLDTMSGIN